ncbi:MAG TPA: DUF167 domain-containing protein [Candidatus Dormibacteraeota bacterium]|nr:DUF167 domain-containing protein [Candidatus Dormibacteraeota bacterium]
MFEAKRTPAGTVIFSVRVSPRARENSITGVVSGALRIRVAAPPAEDRANEALCEFLAERLNIPQAAVKIIRGRHGRLKQVEVRGPALDAVLGLSRTFPP